MSKSFNHVIIIITITQVAIGTHFSRVEGPPCVKFADGLFELKRFELLNTVFLLEITTVAPRALAVATFRLRQIIGKEFTNVMEKLWELYIHKKDQEKRENKG